MTADRYVVLWGWPNDYAAGIRGHSDESPPLSWEAATAYADDLLERFGEGEVSYSIEPLATLTTNEGVTP